MLTRRAEWMRKGCQERRQSWNSPQRQKENQESAGFWKREECFKESVSMILVLKVWASDQQLWPHLRA